MFVRSLHVLSRSSSLGLRRFAPFVSSVVVGEFKHVGSVRSFSIIGDTITKIATNKMESDKGSVVDSSLLYKCPTS